MFRLCRYFASLLVARILVVGLSLSLCVGQETVDRTGNWTKEMLV